MKRIRWGLVAALLLWGGSAWASPAGAAGAEEERELSILERLQTSISRHLGRPYSWGAFGVKSFDCSGFVWRVFQEAGIPVKRTTARKLYMILPKAEEADRDKFGTVVFFNRLKHCGIVNDGTTFYHAQNKKGTNLSPLHPYWGARLSGYRRLPDSALQKKRPS